MAATGLVLAMLLLGGGQAAATGKTAASLSWLAQAGRSRTFLLAATLMLGCGACLLVLAAVLWRIGRPYRTARSAAGGAVVVEFALALPIAMVLSLIMAQSALLMSGNLCVHYAAYCAARSAIVQIPLDVSDDEPANVLDDGYRSVKLRRVRSAALWAVMPICPASPLLDSDPRGQTLAEGLEEFFGAHWQNPPAWVGSGYLGRKFAYADEYTDVTMMRRIGGVGETIEYVELTYPYTYMAHEEVRVEIDHVFYLAVPYAARIFAALDGGTDLDLGAGHYGLEIRAACSMPNEGARDYIEVETFD